MTDILNAIDYCQMVEQRHNQIKRLYSTVTTLECNSPMIDLKESGFNLMFGLSIKEDFKFLVREEVYNKIGRISKILDYEDKVLIICSTWKSFEHQKLLWENRVNLLEKVGQIKPLKKQYKNVSEFISEDFKSMHPTGGTVDALIYDLKKDCVLDFGTNMGLKIRFNKRSYPYYPDIPSNAMNNRKLLINLFEDEGFVCSLKTYWHFNFGNHSWAVQKGKKYAIYGII